MPNFRNTSSREIGILYQGRKISIPPGAIVDGPEHFKMYRGLSRVTDDDVQRYHKILPKVVRQDPSSSLRKFIKPGESLMNSTNIESLPLSAYGIDSIYETKRYLDKYPKTGLKVSVYLDGEKDKVKNFILSTAGRIKFNNVEFIWLNEEKDSEMKTASVREMYDSQELLKMRHSPDLLIIDDYISTFVKVGCISKVKLPNVFEITELSSNFVKNTLIDKYISKSKVDISIVTLTHNPGQYNDMLDDLLKQRLNNSFEIVAIPNYNKEFSSCAESLNLGRELSSGEVVIMCHQDLRVPQGWLQGIMEHVKHFETRNIKWGVLGMAGCNKHGIGHHMDQDLCVIYLSDKVPDGRTYAQAYRGMFGSRKEVQTVDELCMVVPKNAPFKFDEQLLDHFHWYGADICLDALSKGYRNFAIDAECVHLSDGRSNLSGGHAQKFIDDARKIWWKWSNRFPYFRTTTATFMFKEKVIVMGIFILINNGNGNKNLPEVVRMD
jgi:hypothetical protein